LKRSGSGLSSALEAIPEIDALLGDRPAIFLDYDGTLTPIVPDPNMARIGDEERAVLKLLSEIVPVAIVSGRNLDQLRALVAIDGLIYSGNHGWEIEGPDVGSFEHPLKDVVQQELEVAYEELASGARHLPGVAVERKRFSIAVHTRRVQSDPVREAAVNLAIGIVRSFDRLKLVTGKEIAELRPAVAWDKGAGVGMVLDTLSPTRIPIYIGDDQTDEDAFAETARRQGVGVVVGRPNETAAGFWLAGPGEVLAFLGELGRRIQKAIP
jgi:trehalose 6-phosphate phosphatase